MKSTRQFGSAFALVMLLGSSSQASPTKTVVDNPPGGPSRPASGKTGFLKKIQRKLTHVVDAARLGIATRSPTVAIEELRSGGSTETKEAGQKPAEKMGREASPGWHASDFASKSFKVFHPSYLHSKLRSPPSAEASEQATKAIDLITNRWSTPSSPEENTNGDPANVTRQGRETREHKAIQLAALETDAKKLAALAGTYSSGHLVQLSNASEAIVGKYGQLSGETNVEEIKRKLGLDFVAADRQFVDALTSRIKKVSPATNLEKLSPSEMRQTLELFLESSKRRNATEPTPPWIRTLVTKVLNTDNPKLLKTW